MTQLSDALNRARKNRGSWSLRTIERKMQDAGHDVSFSTIGVYLRGEHGKPEERVLKAFAAVLPELSITELRQLAALPAGELGPWEPPAEAARLSQEQRDALNRLIKTIVGPSVTVHAATGSGKTEQAILSLRAKLNDPLGLRDVVEALRDMSMATMADLVEQSIEAHGDFVIDLDPSSADKHADQDKYDVAARKTGRRTKGQDARARQDADAQA